MKMIKCIIPLIMSLVVIISCSSGDDVIQPVISQTCDDGILNGTETGIDCGGTNCQPCNTEVGIEIPDTGFDAPTEYEGYNLVWSDEFNDDVLSSEKWSFDLGSGCPNLCWWGNNELQYYTDESTNLFFEEGNLIIAARNENVGGPGYTSSRINTKNKFEFQYGRIDIRASMPSATGSWVALWLLNHNYTINDPGSWWPSGGEIDIMEYLGEDPNDVFGTAHYGTDFPANHRFNSVHYAAQNGQPFDEVYYVFSIVWEEDSIKWLVNNVEYRSFTPEETQANGQPYPFNDEFYLIMNMSVGGNLPVNPVVSEYPDYLIIDYIRVYQQN